MVPVFAVIIISPGLSRRSDPQAISTSRRGKSGGRGGNCVGINASAEDRWSYNRRGGGISVGRVDGS